MQWVAALIPVRTTPVFLGVAAHDWSWPIAGAIGTFLVAAVALVGLHRLGGGRWGPGLAWLLAGSAIQGPVLLLKHVSQTEAYALVPFVAVPVALGTAALVSGRSPAWAGAAGAVVVAGALAGHAQASRADAADMARNGRIAGETMTRLTETAEALPPGGSLVLLEPRLEVPNYSVYRMRGFVLAPEHELRRLVARRDITISTLPAGSPLPPARPGEVVFTMERGEELIRLR